VSLNPGPQTWKACWSQCGEPAVPTSEGSSVRNGGSSAAPKCSNRTDLHLTLADLHHGFDLPERPSSTSMRLVCIQMLSITQPRISSGGAAIRCPVEPNLDLGRIHQRTAASGTTTVTRARTMPPDSSWLQMRAFPVTSWRRWA
jgi:hypothetical protein